MDTQLYFLKRMLDVDSSWRYCSSSSLEKNMFLIRLSSLSSHTSCLEKLADNIHSSLLMVLLPQVIPSSRLFHLGIFWLLPLRHHTWSWPLLWNHEGHTDCCYYNYQSISLLQLTCMVRMISFRRRFQNKWFILVWRSWWDSLLDNLYYKLL